MIIAAWSLCGCHPTMDFRGFRPAGENIAPQVLPGEWEVLGESVVFLFDPEGMPVAIRNDADPEDFRTNVEFGGASHLSAPIGELDVTLSPEPPFIDAATGEAWFTAHAEGDNIVLFGRPVFGKGRAQFTFRGHFDAQTGELSGASHVEVFYGRLLIYADDVDEYVLRKRQ